MTEDEELDVYAFDVFTATHDEVKAGRLFSTWSTVLVSREEYPTYAAASELAACLAVCVNGGMPTLVMPVY